MECTHLLDNVKLARDSLVDHLAITKNFTCSECGVKEQIWLCLHCGAVNCGRYVNGHAQHHSQAVDHQICISCDVYSVYCYQCDDYVSNDLDNGAIDNIRKSLMQINNCGSSDEITEDKSINEASVVEFNTDLKATGQSLEDVESTTNSEMSICTSMENTDSEIKALKQVKLEEPVRSLRPRSRKRSHSEDSSTDSNHSHFRNNKEKKASPCNGKSQKEKKIVGLKNLGNTCFMNAVLQSLNNIQEFSCYFSQLPSLELKPNGRKLYRGYTRQDFTEVMMAEELRKVLISLQSGGGSKGAISPECLFVVIWKVVPRFRGYQQQDAHEFLRYMLDRLHTELQAALPRGGRARLHSHRRVWRHAAKRGALPGVRQSEQQGGSVPGSVAGAARPRRRAARAHRLPRQLRAGGGAGGHGALPLRVVRPQAELHQAVLDPPPAQRAVSASQAVPLAQLLQDEGGHVGAVPAAVAGHVAVRGGGRRRRRAVRPRRRHRAPRQRRGVGALHGVRHQRRAVVPLQRPDRARHGRGRGGGLQALHPVLHPTRALVTPHTHTHTHTHTPGTRY